jgi:hypothetical protein
MHIILKPVKLRGWVNNLWKIGGAGGGAQEYCWHDIHTQFHKDLSNTWYNIHICSEIRGTERQIAAISFDTVAKASLCSPKNTQLVM